MHVSDYTNDLLENTVFHRLEHPLHGTAPRVGAINLADRTVTVSQRGVEISTEHKGRSGGFGL